MEHTRPFSVTRERNLMDEHENSAYKSLDPQRQYVILLKSFGLKRPEMADIISIDRSINRDQVSHLLRTSYPYLGTTDAKRLREITRRVDPESFGKELERNRLVEIGSEIFNRLDSSFLILLGCGYNFKEIGEELTMKAQRIRQRFVKTIYPKLGVNDHLAATKKIRNAIPRTIKVEAFKRNRLMIGAEVLDVEETKIAILSAVGISSSLVAKEVGMKSAAVRKRLSKGVFNKVGVWNRAELLSVLTEAYPDCIHSEVEARGLA